MTNMFRNWRGALPLALALATAPAVAEEAQAARPDHYHGVPSETLADAVKNLSEYNRKLEAVLAKGALDTADLDQVHLLTYTLENALGRIDAELDVLAETLEAVHLASESGDAATVTSKGQAFLSGARVLVE